MMARLLHSILSLLPILIMFATKALSPLLAIAAVGTLAAKRGAALRNFLQHRTLLWLLGLILIWPLVTALWAPQSGDSFSAWGKVAMICLAGTFLFTTVPQLPAIRHTTLRNMAIALMLVMGLFVLERLLGIPALRSIIEIFGGDYERFMAKTVNRGACAIVMLLWTL